MHKRILPIVLVVLALVAGACSGGDNDKALSEATLQGYLLSADDLPPGFTASEEEDDEEEDDEEDTSCIGRNTGNVEPAADTSAEFSNADNGQQISHELEAHEEGKAAESMAEGRQVLERCRTFEEELEGQTIRGSLSPADFPNLGDETVAFTLQAELAGIAVNAQFVAVRRGEVISVVSMIVPNAAVDRAVFEDVVRKAADQLPA